MRSVVTAIQQEHTKDANPELWTLYELTIVFIADNT